jgi:hypothetical protein
MSCGFEFFIGDSDVLPDPKDLAYLYKSKTVIRDRDHMEAIWKSKGAILRECSETAKGQKVVVELDGCVYECTSNVPFMGHEECYHRSPRPHWLN